MNRVHRLVATARGRWVTVLAVAGGLSALWWAVGISPWPLVIVVVLAGALVIGQRASWPFAIAGSLIVVLAFLAILLRVAPFTGLGLSGAVGLAMALGIAGYLVVLARVRDPRLPHRRALLVGAPAVAVPVLIVVVGGPIALALGAGPTWAMHNDAVWNLMTARFMIEDGGLRADQHPNASPLTGGLIAVAASVGRGAVGAQDLLRHDVSRMAELWLLVVLAGATLAGLIGLRSTHSAPRPLRVVAAVATALIPLSWFVVGFAFQFGFVNASLSMLILLASWLAWLETRVAPLLGSSILSLATVAMLATWAPLAAVPGALAVVALFSRLSVLVRQRGPALVWWAIAAAPVPIYAVVVTLADLRREGAALAVEGGIHALDPLHVTIIGAVATLAVVFYALRTRAPHVLLGFGIVAVASAIGLAYLMLQRVNAGVPYWGYYPVKMAWMVCSLLLVITTAALLASVAEFRGRRVASVLATASVGLLIGTLMMQTPPAWGPRWAHLLPFVDIVTGTGVASSPDQARELFAIAEDGQKDMAVRLIDPGTDRFLNSWLLQLESDDALDPIRHYSYLLNPEDDAQVCEAIRVWGGDVRVHTSDPRLDERLARLCPDADVTVVLR